MARRHVREYAAWAARRVLCEMYTHFRLATRIFPLCIASIPDWAHAARSTGPCPLTMHNFPKHLAGHLNASHSSMFRAWFDYARWRTHLLAIIHSDGVECVAYARITRDKIKFHAGELEMLTLIVIVSMYVVQCSTEGLYLLAAIRYSMQSWTAAIAVNRMHADWSRQLVENGDLINFE